MDPCTNICVLLWRLLLHDLIGLLVHSSIRVFLMQHVMQISENLTIEALISRTGGTDVGGFFRVIYRELCI
jgi:hypothetical protein